MEMDLSVVLTRFALKQSKLYLQMQIMCLAVSPSSSITKMNYYTLLLIFLCVFCQKCSTSISLWKRCYIMLCLSLSGISCVLYMYPGTQVQSIQHNISLKSSHAQEYYVMKCNDCEWLHSMSIMLRSRTVSSRSIQHRSGRWTRGMIEIDRRKWLRRVVGWGGGGV